MALEAAARSNRAWVEQMRRARELAAEAGSSFRKFVPLAWPVIEPAKAFIPAWHIEAICDHMQAVADGQIKRLLITVPPGSAKSVLVAVAFPAWMWTPGRNPGWRSTFASYDSSLSTRDSVRCRDLLESPWYQSVFQPQWRFATDQNEKTYYVNTAKGFRVSTSVGGKGTGWRSNFLGIDDSLNAKDRYSDAALNTCVDWLDNVMFNRLIDLRMDAIVIIMQRLSDRDLAGHVLRQGGYEHLCIPMEYDPARSKVTSIGWKDPRSEPGELMFPALFPREVVDNLKKNAEAWHGQYQQNPVAEGGGILKSHWWQYWRPAGMSLPPVQVVLPDGSIEARAAVEIPSRFDLQLQSWDLAFKDVKDADFVVGAVVKVAGARRYITDISRGRMDFPATLNAIRELTGRNPEAHLKLIEDKANGPAVVDSLKNEIPGLVPVSPEGGKIARAAGVSHEVSAGNWFLPHPMIAPWVGSPDNPLRGGFLAESTAFPFGPNDDQVDAWSQAGIRIQKEQVGGVFGVSPAEIVTDHIDPIPPTWPRQFGLCINWREVGAVWLCCQPDTGQHYAYAEYSVPAGPGPSQHAAELKLHGAWVPGVMHAADAGRDQQDGYALISQYQKLGVKLESASDNVDAEIADLQEALRGGKLRIFSGLSRLLDQYRMFRRDDKGKLPTVQVAVVYALLVAWKHRSGMRPTPEPEPDRNRFGAAPSPNSWMGW